MKKIGIRIDLSADKKTMTYSFIKIEEPEFFTGIDEEFIGTIENPDYCNSRGDLQQLEEMDPEAVKRYKEILEKRRVSYQRGVMEALFAAFSKVDVICFSGNEPDVIAHYSGTFRRP